MDEPLLRFQQALEQLKCHLRMTAANTLHIVRQCTDDGYALAVRTIHDHANAAALRQHGQQAWQALLRALDAIQRAAVAVPTPRDVYDELRAFLRDEIRRNNMFYVFCGIGVGTVGGFLLGIYWSGPLAPPVMKAIACTHLHGPNYVNLCHTAMPTFGRRPCDILVRVRAATINRLDARITDGFGATFRRLMRPHDAADDPNAAELPLPLGRACAGIVEAVGAGARSGLEIGDEVWLAATWWERGLAAEYVVAPECRVARKPFAIGFEGAASLPYSGCVALDALRRAGLDEVTCKGRRVLVQEGCSPVGCVLTQLCRLWGAASVAATCSVRSVPVIRALGADDVITIESEPAEAFALEQHVLFKELSIRPEYDVIFYTTAVTYDTAFMEAFLTPHGQLIDTVEPAPASDHSGPLGRWLLAAYVRMRVLFALALKRPGPEWGGPHLCHRSLERLAEWVNEGQLQTVVDQVYTPQDADAAMSHVCGAKSIGSTIVTFRA